MGFVDGLFGRRDSLECVEGAPGLDEAAESVVRGEIVGGGEGLFGDGAGRVLAGKQPFFDAFPVVGDPG